MSKETSILALGVWVFILPFLGVPGSWRTVFLVLSGIAIVILGFLLRGEAMAKGPRIHRGRGHHSSHSFVEHIPEAAHDTAEQGRDGIGSLN